MLRLVERRIRVRNNDQRNLVRRFRGRLDQAITRDIEAFGDRVAGIVAGFGRSGMGHDLAVVEARRILSKRDAASGPEDAGRRLRILRQPVQISVNKSNG